MMEFGQSWLVDISMIDAHVQERGVEKSKLVVCFPGSPFRMALTLMRASDPLVPESRAHVKVSPDCGQNVFGSRFRRYLDEAGFGLYEEVKRVHAVEDDFQAGEVPLVVAFRRKYRCVCSAAQLIGEDDCSARRVWRVQRVQKRAGGHGLALGTSYNGIYLSI